MAWTEEAALGVFGWTSLSPATGPEGQSSGVHGPAEGGLPQPQWIQGDNGTGTAFKVLRKNDFELRILCPGEHIIQV